MTDNDALENNLNSLSPKLLYEDEEIIVLDKPAGWLTHPDGRTVAPVVTDWLVAHDPKIRLVGDQARPGIVHRLDRGTSGVLVTAKDEVTYHALRLAFTNRTIKKSYRLIVYGEIKVERGTINSAIARSASDPMRRVISKLGREALTDYQVLERFAHETYVEAYPKTGRTHQLRVHFKSLQHPILGDRLYASTRELETQAVAMLRPALHAYSIELPPRAGRPNLFIAPLPLDFFRALASLRALC